MTPPRWAAMAARRRLSFTGLAMVLRSGLLLRNSPAQAKVPQCTRPTRAVFTSDLTYGAHATRVTAANDTVTARGNRRFIRFEPSSTGRNSTAHPNAGAVATLTRLRRDLPAPGATQRGRPPRDSRIPVVATKYPRSARVDPGRTSARLHTGTCGG